jgi:hypothetical protein
VLIVAWMGCKVILDGLKVLLDASVEKDVLERAEVIASEEDEVREVLDVQGRNSGSYRFINLSLQLYTRDLREAEAISAHVKERLRAGIENVDQISVDFSVESGRAALCAVPLREDGVAISPRFEDAPRFGLLEIKAGDKKRVLARDHRQSLPGRGGGRGSAHGGLTGAARSRDPDSAGIPSPGWRL